jgi:hypothetical protein
MPESSVVWWRSPVVWISAALGAFSLVGSIVLLTWPTQSEPTAVGPEAMQITPSPAGSVESGPSGASGASAPGEAKVPPPVAEGKAPAPPKRAPSKPAAKSAPVAPPAAEPAGASSSLVLRVVGKSAADASVVAKVYVDGKLVGTAPVTRKVVPGERRIRFDCVFEGKTYRGKDQVVDIPPDTDAEIEHTCDVWVNVR